MRNKKTHAVVFFTAVSALLLISTGLAQAQTANTSSEANTRCADWQKTCAANGTCNDPPTFSQQAGGGTVSGTCSGSEFKGETFTDPQGETKPLGGLGEAMGFLQQALGALQNLLGGGQGGGSGGGSSGGGSSGGAAPIQPAQIPSTGAQTPSDPTASILESVFSNKADEITPVGQEDEGQPSANFLEAVSRGFGNITSKVAEVTVGIADTLNPPKASPSIPDAGAQKLLRERGEVRTTDDGATIEISTELEDTGVSGFYGVIGSSVPDSDSLSLIGRLCVTRPWASGFVSGVIPASFFDGLCERGGYHVGPWPEIGQDPVNATQVVQQAAQRAKDSEEPIQRKELGISCLPEVVRQGSAAALIWSCGTGEQIVGTVGFTAGANQTSLIVRPSKTTTYGISCSDDFEDSCTVTVINPRVAIWAEPEAARLGSRAIIYWNTQDVDEESCEVVGPSFQEYGPFGGASTVSINGPTEYTVTCTALDGDEVIETVTVELAF